MRIDRFSRFALGLAILSLTAAPSNAGIYQGPGHYVAVHSTYQYRVADNRSAAFRSVTYYGAIEGPFPTKAACETRVTELRAVQQTRDPQDGYAMFMCYLLNAPMKDDSGAWWNPRRDE